YTALRSVYAPPHAVMPRAKAAAAQALALDPKLAAAHVSMGGVMMFYDFDWDGAERELREAIALSPNLAEAHDYYALLLAVKGRKAEAFEESALARSLDPMSLTILNNAGWVHYLGGEPDRTIALNRKALEIDPGFWPAMRDLGLGYEKMGRFEEAVTTLEHARRLDANPSILEMLAGAYAAWGKNDAARKVLAELERQANEQYVCPYEIATVYAGLGDKAATMTWLEKGHDERADCMPWARSDPKLDVMRGDPRFDALMQRMRISIEH
ncbi:MAG: hypothetical protein M3478_05980, partial [Planctomycetota bacterium]|nr:hypothetical protein [Planctomycetota bacterium]